MDFRFDANREGCPASQRDIAIDFMIKVDDGSCWLNVHPDHLNVYDSSSFSSHLKLLQTYQVSNVLTLKTETVTFGAKELQKLIVDY